MRNKSFLESLLSDVGSLVNGDCLELNPERLDVTSVMVFTNHLGIISKKIKVSVDGEIFTILVIEDSTVSWDK